MAFGQDTGPAVSQPNAATLPAGAGPNARLTGGTRHAASASGPEEVVVTAQKRKQSVYGVGMAITALSGAQLRQQGITTVAGLTKIDPSFVFANSAFGAPVYTIRGIGYNDFSLSAAPTVSVYLDEVPYPYPLVSKGATLDVGQVEILKGPQGTLYGQNATGGAVNYLAAKPTDRFQAGLEGTYGNFDASDLNGYISGALAPTLNGRASFDVTEGGAYQKSATRSETLGDKDIKKGRVILDWTPTDDWKVSLNLNGFTDNSDSIAAQKIGLDLQDPQFASRVPFLFRAPNAQPNDQSADWYHGIHPRNDEGFFQGTVRADYTGLQNVTLTYLGAYEQYQQNDLESANGADVAVTRLDGGSIIATSQELRAAGKLLDNRLDWLLGADYSQALTKENELFDLAGASNIYPLTAFGIPAFQSLRDISRDDAKSGAAFGNVEYHITPNLDVHAGARFTQTDIDHDGCTQDVDGNLAKTANFLERVFTGGRGNVVVPQGGCTTFAPGFVPALIKQKLDQNNAPWRVGIDWKPFRQTLLYATISKGYKAGSFTTTPASTALVLRPVTQEALLAYEAGFKSRLLDNRLEIDGDYFHYDYTNKQLELRQPDPNGIFGLLNTLLNVPKSTEDGVELTTRLRPLPGVTLTAAGTYLDSRIDGSFVNYSPLSPVPIDIGGEAFPDVPKWSGRFGAQYDFDLNDRYAAFIGLNARIQSRASGAFGTYNDAQLGYPSFELRGYGILDLRAGINSNDGHWHLQVFGNNVTNTYYWNQVVRSGDVIVRYAGLPTIYGITLGYQY